MTTQRRRPPFTISTEAAFSEGGVWVIGARLRFHQGAPGKTRSALLGEAKTALMTELIREALRGRAHGANAIRVRLDAGGRVNEFSFDDRVPNIDLFG